MEDLWKSQEETPILINILIQVLVTCIVCIMVLLLGQTNIFRNDLRKRKSTHIEQLTEIDLPCLINRVDKFIHHLFILESEIQGVKGNLSSRVQSDVKENDKTTDLVSERDELDMEFPDLADLDDYLTSDEILTDDEDDNEIELSIEPLEETEYYLNHNHLCLMQSRKDYWSRFTHEEIRESVPLRNDNQLHSDAGKVQNEMGSEKNRRVFCDSYWFDDYSYNLDSPGLNSSLQSLTEESMCDSLHISNKVKTWNNSHDLIDGDYIDVIVNDIVCHFANTTQQPENNSESGEKSKGYEATVCKTTHSQETAVLLESTEEVDVKKVKPKKRQKNHRSCRRRRNRRRAQRSLRDIINWQISLRRNTAALHDVRQGITDGRIHTTALYDAHALPGTTDGRIALLRDAYRSSNENDQNSEDSRGAVNGNHFVTEELPLNAEQRKPNIERDHIHANGVKESLEVPLGYQNGLLDNKSAQIADNKSSETTEEGGQENGASYILSLQSDTASNGFSLTTTDTLSSFFNSVSLFSVGEDEAFSFEWIRLKTFSDWPLNSIFSTVLARNGWVSLGDGDKARCYSCHVVHKGWRIGDIPDQYHSPNCRFKSGQSNNAPISRAATSNQTSTPGQISQDHQQFPFPGNPLYPGNISVVASSGGHPGPVLGVSEQALSRPQQDSIQPRESNPRPQEIYPQPQEMRETNTAARTGNLNVAPIQQLSAGLPTSEVLTASTPTPRNTDSTRNAPTPRNTDSTGNTNTSRNTGTPTPQVPTDNLQSTAAAEAPPPHSKEAQLEALKRDPMGINFDRPKYPSYAILAVRISSYTDWPAAMTQTPRDMALAGFFYAGYGDYTRCFFCGGGLRNWEAGDDPWVEHARWFMKCAFVRQNRGQEFIDLVQKRAAELDEQGNQEGMGNSQKNPAISDPNSAEAKEEKVMRSPAVTTIKEMGYSEDKIKAAIRTIKSRLPRGKHKVSAQEILEVIFELNQLESRTPVDQSERVSDNPTNSTNQSDSVAENTGYNTSQSDPAPVGNQNSAVDASNADQSSLDDHEKRNSLPNPIFDELTSLKQENTSLKDQIMCKICMEKNVSIAFLPCGHLACCEDCAPAMRKCPICREFVRGTVKTFLV